MRKVYKKLKKYTFSKGDFIIKPAQSPAELVKEGMSLHHCVGTYARYVSKGETAIFFIRKKETPDEPFYTLEYENGIIVQCRTINNQSYELNEQVKSFVNEWYEKIRKGA